MCDGLMVYYMLGHQLECMVSLNVLSKPPPANQQLGHCQGHFPRRNSCPICPRPTIRPNNQPSTQPASRCPAMPCPALPIPALPKKPTNQPSMPTQRTPLSFRVGGFTRSLSRPTSSISWLLGWTGMVARMLGGLVGGLVGTSYGSKAWPAEVFRQGSSDWEDWLGREVWLIGLLVA